MALTNIAGFDYSKSTKKGFEKQRKKGAVTAPIRNIQATQKIIQSLYDRLINQLVKLVEEHFKTQIVTDAYIPGFSDEFLRAMREMQLGVPQPLVKRINNEMAASKRDYFKDFGENSDPRVALRVSFALKKDDVFNNRLDRLQQLYLDGAVNRIAGEQDKMKADFLQYFTDWVTGASTDFDSFKSIIDKMKQTSVRQSRFFARDQFSRFNKALTVASYEEADVKYVKWLTVDDQRVRGKPGGLFPKALPSHWALHGRIYRVDNLPREMKDYNCRCVLVPYFPKEGEQVKVG